MDVSALQTEIRQLPERQQDQLAAFLTSLRMQREGTQQELQRRLDDKTSENWQSWKAVKQELNLHEGSDS
jgi:hypothetical protein